MLGKFHELRLSMEEPASESDMLDMESNEPSKRLRTLGKAWSFDREWECALFDDARKMADFVVETDIKSKMPANLEIKYLVVLFNVHISNTTGVAYAQMNGYLQSSKQLTLYALRRWFPENEGINLSIVKGGLCGSLSYESDMKKKSPWMIYNVIGEIRLNNSGKRQVTFRPSHHFRRVFLNF